MNTKRSRFCGATSEKRRAGRPAPRRRPPCGRSVDVIRRRVDGVRSCVAGVRSCVDGVRSCVAAPAAMLSRIWCRLCGSTPTVGSSRDEQQRLVEQPGRDVRAALHPARVPVDPVAGALREPDDVEHLRDLSLEPRPSRALVEATEEAEVLRSPGRPTGSPTASRSGGDRRSGGSPQRRRRGRRRCPAARARSPPSPPTPSWSSAAGHAHGPGVRCQDPGHDRDRGRLACAVRPEQPVRLPVPDLEADPVHRDAVAESPDEPLAAQYRLLDPRRGSAATARPCASGVRPTPAAGLPQPAVRPEAHR
jgi:hypothetical protein